VYANNPHGLEDLKRIFMKQFTSFSNVNCNRFTKICLKDFRHVSHQRAGILIIYDGEYNISYYVWLIINESSKQCANSTGRAQAISSASDTAVLQEVKDGNISIQSACALNTVYFTEFPITGLLEPT
jgi:hypothetical protein